MCIYLKIVIGIICLGVLYVIAIEIKQRRYYKNAKKGTACYFYIENDRFKGCIDNRDGDLLLISENGKCHVRIISETYPV